MSVSMPGKELYPGKIPCGGTARVRLSFLARPGILSAGGEVVLVLDRSCSMTRERLERMKAGAGKLLDELEGSKARERGVRAGLVSFDGEAKAESEPTGDFDALRALIEKLKAGGRTNHASALRTGAEAFSPGEGRKIMILFTDGSTTAGENPEKAAREAREAGIEIFCIALCTDPASLKSWVSAPWEEHLLIAEDTGQLEDRFAELGVRLTCPGAREAVVREQVGPEFEIISVGSPSAGRAYLEDRRTLRWEVGTVGRKEPERVELSFTIRHLGAWGGRKKVNAAITYEDRGGGRLRFPDPVLEVECPEESVCPEPCPEGEEFCLDRCERSKCVCLEGTCLEGQGRVVEVSTVIRSVCPERRVALAVTLSEVDGCGREEPRGMKVLTVPAHRGPYCRDVAVRCIRFVLPDEEGCHCRPRRFRARVIANYLDTDFVCCPPSQTAVE